MNPKAHRNELGLTLIEVLAGGFALSVILAGLTAAWHVLDYQLMITRLQDRVSRVVRQANDWTLYAPYDTLPSNGAQLLSGYLFQPFDQQTQTYQQELPYSFTASVAVNNPGTISESKEIQLTLNYSLPAPLGHETQAHQIQLPSTLRSSR
jgi:hypothetical protein